MGRRVQTHRTGRCDHSGRLRTPRTPGRRRPPQPGSGGLGLGSARLFGSPAPPPPDSAPQFPTGAGLLLAGHACLRSPCPRVCSPSARAVPAYLVWSPPLHHQQAPAAHSLQLRPLPASQALDRGHVTDGRRADARAHPRRIGLGLSLPPPRLLARLAPRFSVTRARRLEWVSKSDPVHIRACLPLTLRVKLESPAR